MRFIQKAEPVIWFSVLNGPGDHIIRNSVFMDFIWQDVSNTADYTLIMNSLSDGSFYLTYQDDDKLKDKLEPRKWY